MIDKKFAIHHAPKPCRMNPPDGIATWTWGSVSPGGEPPVFI